MYSGQIASARPALLSVDRRQDRQVRRARRPSDFSGAGRSRRHTVYPNGISTSLPEDVQHALVATIPGLENARIRPARATRSNTITSIRASSMPTLETKKIARACFWPARSTARPATKRLRHRDFWPASTRRRRPATATQSFSTAPKAYHRRHDRRSGDARRHRAVSHVHLARRISSDAARRQCRSASDRKRASRIGCVGAERARLHRGKNFCARRRARLREIGFAHAERSANVTASRSTKTASAARAFELLSYPNIAIADLARVWPRFARTRSPKIAEQIEIDAKYEVYLSRQAADVAAYRRDESFALPDDLDYAALPGLSNEVKQKLRAAAAHHRPGRQYRRHDAGGADAAGRACPARPRQAGEDRLSKPGRAR